MKEYDSAGNVWAVWEEPDPSCEARALVLTADEESDWSNSKIALGTPLTTIWESIRQAGVSDLVQLEQKTPFCFILPHSRVSSVCTALSGQF